jgi:hypothetical protein
MLVEQEIVILPEHPSSSSVFSGVRILPVKGENISISSNQREAHLNIVNPCAVCFFERPIMRGETLCFSVEPIVRDGKVTHNFSFKVAITVERVPSFYTDI